MGFGAGTDPNALGALRSVGGANTWTGAIQLTGGNNIIGVDAGGSLNVSGQVSAGTGGGINLLKVGGGTLRLSGSTANVYFGTTTVLRGTLELAKDAGKDAIGGDLVIGDNIGGDNAATVRLLANDQIRQLNFYDAALTTITLNSSGTAMPRSRAAKTTPAAISSFEAKIAVGRGERSSSRSAAVTPVSNV